ncbi:MAG: hypothetical protein DVB28_001464 [Verrucomicrobia bacterium]|nr:MAG: hypothetical protein DVB28_001464 [Verrucomicrobiota bacterium]
MLLALAGGNGVAVEMAHANPAEQTAGTGREFGAESGVASGFEKRVDPKPANNVVSQKTSAVPFETMPDGRIRIGLVTLDKAKREISFPAKINMREGLVEYAVVTSAGKVHESVFVTDASPTHLHLAALLLKMCRIDVQGAPPQISIFVDAPCSGSVKCESLDKYIVYAKDNPEGLSGATLPPTAWNYSGALLNGGNVSAESEGSIISLISDATALISNPREGRLDDTLHLPNSRMLSEVGLPVVIRFRSFEATEK